MLLTQYNNIRKRTVLLKLHNVQLCMCVTSYNKLPLNHSFLLPTSFIFQCHRYLTFLSQGPYLNGSWLWHQLTQPTVVWFVELSLHDHGVSVDTWFDLTLNMMSYLINAAIIGIVWVQWNWNSTLLKVCLWRKIYIMIDSLALIA